MEEASDLERPHWSYQSSKPSRSSTKLALLTITWFINAYPLYALDLICHVFRCCWSHPILCFMTPQVLDFPSTVTSNYLYHSLASMDSRTGFSKLWQVGYRQFRHGQHLLTSQTVSQFVRNSWNDSWTWWQRNSRSITQRIDRAVLRS